MTENCSNYLYHSAYLAPVTYYSLLRHDNRVLIDDKEYFQKLSYRNRCQIMTANGKMELIIPVVKGASSHTNTIDVRIAEHDNWQLRHWRALCAAYSSSPFFEYYEDDFKPFYTEKWESLWEFNYQMQTLVLNLLDMENVTFNASDLIVERIIDLKNKIHPKTEFENLKPYFQVFERKFGFQPNLSIVDLLFNMGPESVLYLINIGKELNFEKYSVKIEF